MVGNVVKQISKHFAKEFMTVTNTVAQSLV